MQKPSSSKMRLRMTFILVLIFVTGFVILVCRLFLLQVVRGEMYQARALQQQTRSTTLGAKRGTIYDRNGQTLAWSGTVWNVCLSPAQLKQETLDQVATDLAEILDVSKEKILEEAADRSSYYKRIKMRVDRGLADKVLEYTSANDVDGVFFEEDTKRYYTYGSLASTVLGFTNYDNEGAYGLEAYYNKVLSGTPGVVVSTKNAWGSDMPLKYQQMYPAEDGNSVVLTIDESIQHFLERNLETAVIEHNIGNRASGIVMDIKTGEILAMSSKPDFDPNEPYVLQDPDAAALLATYTEGTEEYTKMQTNLWYNQWRNKAISDPYEPGSVFKIITAATALDNKIISIHDSFFCSGSVNVSGTTIGCWQHRGHGQQNFIEGMQNSCNPVFIAVGQRIGAPLFYDYLDNFGLSEPTGIDLPGEADSILQTFEVLNKEGMVELSSSSFGQTNKVTPLQLITAVSAAVNGGKLMQPYIVKQVLDKEGNVIETTQPVVKRQVVSEETSETMKMLVEAVVDGGSGRYAAIPGYRIGGKTGTSEKIDLKPLDLHILSFVGFAPMDDPQYAILIMLDEPEQGGQFGSVIAAPVVGAVFQEMLPYVGLEPQYTAEELAEREVEVPSLTGKKPHDAQAELTGKGLKTRFVGNGPEVVKQIPQAFQKMPKGGTVILYTDEESVSNSIVVPDVVGMSAQEANRTLVEMGLNIALQGVTTDGVSTYVSEQWPLAGTEAATGDVVRVTLAEKPPEAEQPVVALEISEIEAWISQDAGGTTQDEPDPDGGGEDEIVDEADVYAELD